MKGFKCNKFGGGHCVPFFVVYCDRFKESYDGLSSLLDILLTVIVAAGIDIGSSKNPLDGTNLPPYLSSEKSGEPHEILFWRKNNQAAVRMGNYKYIRVKGVGERLCNLRDNLQENSDFCESEPEIRAQMSDSLDSWKSERVNLVLWDEGARETVNIDTHQNLMLLHSS
ncbi:MAG: hypothetical protein MR292_06995 [Alistipes sp.]|nr:hypothetical protein [Alistipes sp.]